MTSDRPADGPGDWREPEHLGGGPPPGPASAAPPARQRTGWLRRRGRADSDVGRTFTAQGDLPGAQAWAMVRGFELSDGAGPRDAQLAELVRTAPARPGRDARPGAVARGRWNGLEVVAFDVVEPVGRDRWVATWAITALPLLTAVPDLRLSPVRLWKHRTAGLVALPSGDDELDGRWVLLAAADDPRARAVLADPQVRALLLGSDDRDELWTAAGHLAAIRPDGQRPGLVEHAAPLLAAVAGALTAIP